MATGTGKTFSAIGCIDEIRRNHDKLVVVISCPFDNLERQWQKELTKWNIESIVTSGSTKWLQIIKDGIASLDLDSNKNIFVIITTYKTFSSDAFVRTIENCDISTMLIADEVHNAGSPTYVTGLSDGYDYRLGLSATLERYFDPQGTNELQVFFGDTVYELDLSEAIRREFLTEYDYHVIYANLNEEEYERYRNLTRIIARLWNSKKREDLEHLENARIKRSWIIRDAEDKIEKFTECIELNSDSTKYSLVYCSEKQMPTVKSILNKSGIINHEITAKNPSDPRQRQGIIDKFSAGLYSVIVANRVLDEGADIPSAKNCIMLASTGNPKQFIQRRGRVLRKFSGKYKDGSTKDFATIYDIFVVPELDPDYTEDEIRTERQILSSQIRRMEEMAKVARNSDSCMIQIKELKKKFHM